MSLDHLLKCAETTLQMTARRDMVKRRHGADYADRSRIVGEIIKGVAEEAKCGLLEAALLIAKGASDEGQLGAVDLVIAAVVDLLEVQEDARTSR